MNADVPDRNASFVTERLSEPSALVGEARGPLWVAVDDCDDVGHRHSSTGEARERVRTGVPRRVAKLQLDLHQPVVLRDALAP